MSQKLKLTRALQMQRALSGRSGAWFLEPSGDSHDVDPQECLRSTRSRAARDSHLVEAHLIEDSNDEFEKDRIGF